MRWSSWQLSYFQRELQARNADNPNITSCLQYASARIAGGNAYQEKSRWHYNCSVQPRSGKVAAVPSEPIDSVDFGYRLYTTSCLTYTTYTWNGEDGINREYVRHLWARPPLQSTSLRVGTPRRGCVMQGNLKSGKQMPRTDLRKLESTTLPAAPERRHERRSRITHAHNEALHSSGISSSLPVLDVNYGDYPTRRLLTNP
jgi:hypothetical protein